MNQDNKYHVPGSAAELYQSIMVPRQFVHWAARLVEDAGVTAGESVLDAACGTGVVTRRAAEAAGSGGAVTGLDVNPAMLGVAGAQDPVDGAPISWVEGDAAAMPLPDDAFDVVLCQQGFQFFPDRAGAAREMCRVARPGGRLAATVWRPIEFAPGHEALADAVERYGGPEAAAVRRAPYEIGGAAVIRDILAGAGFTDVRIVIAVDIARFESPADLVQSAVAGTPLAAFMADSPPETVEDVIGMVAERLADYLDDDGLALPMQTWVMTARA